MEMFGRERSLKLGPAGLMLSWERLPNREQVNVYIQVIHFFVQQKLTKNCEATIPQF